MGQMPPPDKDWSKLSPDDRAVQAIWKLIASGKPRFPRVAEEFGLAPQQLHLLRLLEPGVSLPMGELAGLLYCDASNVTNIVDRLEARELIERKPDPADRRVKRIEVTKAGAALRAEALKKLWVAPNGIKKLTSADRKALGDLLVKAAKLHDSALED